MWHTMRLDILAANESQMVANDVASAHAHKEVHAQLVRPAVVVDAVYSLGADHDRNAHTQSLLQMDVCDRVARKLQIIIQDLYPLNDVACSIGLCDQRRRFLQMSNLLGQKLENEIGLAPANLRSIG